MAKVHTINAGALAIEHLKVTVKFERLFWFRCRVAILIIHTAALFCPLDIDIIEHEART